MILVFDVGNTNMVIGVYQGKELLTHWRIKTDEGRTSDEYGMLLKNLFDFNGLSMSSITAVVISSVVPSLMMELERVSRDYYSCKPLVVGPGIKTGLAIKYENPREVGADRVVNAVAAYHKYKGPLIIVDFGTATTFCVVNEEILSLQSLHYINCYLISLLISFYAKDGTRYVFYCHIRAGKRLKGM